MSNNYSRMDRYEKRKGLYEKMIKMELEKLELSDYCTEYQFDKIGDAEFFNDRFNDPYMKSYLKWDRTRDFFQDIDRQIYLQSNEVLMVYGPKGMGKSEVLMFLMKYWQERYYEIKQKTVNKKGLLNYVGFSDSQLRSIIRIMTAGDILGRDESPLSSGTGARTDTNALQNFVNQTRELQTSSIFVNPVEIQNISGIDYYLEVAGKRGVYYCENCQVEYINKKSCPECHGPTQIIHAKSYTRIIWYDRRSILMGFIYIPLHEDEAFREAYHQKKVSNMKSTMIHGGGVHSYYDKKSFTKDLINLYEFCVECEASSLADVKTHLTNYNLQFDPLEDADLLIGGSVEYINDVVRNVTNAIKGNLHGNPLKEYLNREREQEEGELLSYEAFAELEQEGSNVSSGPDIPSSLDFADYTYSEDALLDLIRKEQKSLHNVDRDIEIYRMNRDTNKTQVQIGSIFNIGGSNVSQQISKIQGLVNYYKGKEFETFVQKKLKRSKKFGKIIKLGNPGESDILAYSKDDSELVIYSIKNLKISKSPFWLEYNELEPEIKEANRNDESDYKNKTTMILLVYDNVHDQIIQLPYDFKNPRPIELTQYLKK